MTDQNSESVTTPETISQTVTVQDIPSNEIHIGDTAEVKLTPVEVKLTPVEIDKASDNAENNKPKSDVLQEILKSNANFYNMVNIEEEDEDDDDDDDEEVAKFALATQDTLVHRSLPKKSKVSKKYSCESSSESSDFESLKRKPTDKSYDRIKLKHATEIIPDIGFSSGNTSKTFDDVREMIAYYNKHKETFHNYNTQKINRMLQCEGYKFSKIGGNFNIVATDTSASKPRETWKNKSIELEKTMQTIQHNNERLRNDVDMLTAKLVKAYSKISSQSHDIENLTKVVSNMYETQIPTLVNKINKLKLANKYAH